jgi:hypothetical protein
MYCAAHHRRQVNPTLYAIAKNMKTKIQILILLTLGNFACSSEFYTVTARDGLYVREQPIPTGKHVLDAKRRHKVLLQKGEKVRLLFVDKVQYKANGIEDNFAFVEYRGSNRGYVFKGFLESSSGNFTRLLLTLTLILIFASGVGWLVFRYRQQILSSSQKAGQFIRKTYLELREKQKSKAELNKIEQQLKEERAKEIALATAAERERQMATKIVSRQVRAVKWLLFFIVIALFAVNNPSRSDFAAMIREKVSSSIQQQTDDLEKLMLAAGKMVGIDIQAAGEDAISQYIISRTREIDCFIFTIYFVPTQNRPIAMIGILRKFIPIASL